MVANSDRSVANAAGTPANVDAPVAYVDERLASADWTVTNAAGGFTSTDQVTANTAGRITGVDQAVANAAKGCVMGAKAFANGCEELANADKLPKNYNLTGVNEHQGTSNIRLNLSYLLKQSAKIILAAHYNPNAFTIN